MNIHEQNKLTKKEKEAVVLLSIGTFLEYFDIMLYIHMAALLNDLFFPKTDPLITQLLVATTFSLTYILRPVGGFMIGKIGDSAGRKNTIIFTTFIMACSCITMAILPTYLEIGILATIIMIICRMLQGFSSLGETIGAQIYLSEMLKSPYKAMASGAIGVATQTGGLFSLIVASFTISIALNWRYAFWVGAIIAVVGVFARLRLRETPEFVSYKQRIKKNNMQSNAIKKVKNINTTKIQIDKKLVLSYFLTELYYPLCFYIVYIYMGELMKKYLHMTGEEVINHNLKVAIFTVGVAVIVACFAKKIHPIKAGFAGIILMTFFLPIIPYWIDNNFTEVRVFIFQCIIIATAIPTCGTLDAILYKYFPIERRFTLAATVFGVANPISKFTIAFSTIPLIFYLGNYGLWVLFIPSLIGYLWSINYLKKLEIKSGNYYHYPYKDEDVEVNIHPYNYELGEEYNLYQKECKYSKRLIYILESINKTTKKEVNIRLVEKAIVFAKKWHGKQKRKTGEPFYSHPLEVAKMVAEFKFKTHMVVAAILHDVVEDSDCTVELISREFTPRIAEIVELLTREYKGKKLSIAETIKRIFTTEDYEALLIKGLDRVHNLQTIGVMKPEKRKEIAEETIYEIASIAAYAVDDLNINDKSKLERKLYKLSNKILRKSKRLE